MRSSPSLSAKEMFQHQEYFDYFSDQLSMDLLKKDYPYDSEMLDNILELIVQHVVTFHLLI